MGTESVLHLIVLLRNSYRSRPESSRSMPTVSLPLFCAFLSVSPQMSKAHANPATFTDNIEIMTFNQSRFPRVNKESLLPSPRSATEDRGMW